MKKLFYITLTLALFCAMNQNVSAWVNSDMDRSVVEEAQKGNYAFFRLDNFNKDVYLAFNGPAHKLGDNVDVKIYQGKSSILLHQENFMAHGNGQLERISIDEFQTGTYYIVVTSERYNLSQPFVLE